MKSEKIIREFFKPYFEKYPEMEDIWFLIYDFDDGIYLAEEDSGINGKRWDELSDDKLYETSYQIQKAVDILKESKIPIPMPNIINELEKIWNKLQKDADDSNPLNKVLDDVWSDENRKALTKKVKKYLEKEIAWKYVDYCQCTVTRTGTVKIDEHQSNYR